MRNMIPIGRLQSLGVTGGGGGFTEADKEILVKIVKHAQWLGVSGTKGPWRKFLATIDRALPQNHDPSKRPWNVLASFVDTWKDEKDIEIVKRARAYIKYKRMADVLETTEPWPDFPEEKLARLTRQHPLYSRDYNFPSYHEGWVRSELVSANDLRTPPNLLAIDCEMVICEDGTMQVVRVCLVDRDLQTVLDTLVQPSKKVKEYKSHITGITSEDLESVTLTQSEIQSQVKGTLSPETIVVGHSLHNDLRALHIDHRRVIDTAYIFPVQNRPRIWSPPLRDLCKLVLGYDFREDDKPHDCLEDARIPMKLALHCVKEGLQPINIPDEVDEAVLSKLLIHKVPKDVRYEELKFIFPRSISFEFQEIEKDLSNTSKYFSTYAVFASKEVANRAFNQLKGTVTEDITGRLQKNVHIRSRFQHKNALRIGVVVRKMDTRTSLEESVDTEGSLDLNMGEKCSKTAQDSAMGGSFGNYEQVSNPKRSRSEEAIENPSFPSPAKRLKRKKQGESHCISAVGILSHDAIDVEVEHKEEIVVEVKNALQVHLEVTKETPHGTPGQKKSFSVVRKKSSKKRKRSKGKKK